MIESLIQLSITQNVYPPHKNLSHENKACGYGLNF